MTFIHASLGIRNLKYDLQHLSGDQADVLGVSLSLTFPLFLFASISLCASATLVQGNTYTLSTPSATSPGPILTSCTSTFILPSLISPSACCSNRPSRSL